MEKTLACYGGDPSRLLDVCRARLVFDTAAALLRGVDAVLGGAGPPETGAAVRIVRVRNGFKEAGGSEAGLALGFRVRIRVVCPSLSLLILTRGAAAGPVCRVGC